MISEDQIIKLTGKYQTVELNIRREYLQHLFLSYFYSLPNSDTVCFKGGTALRLIYRSPRFSEDLDFDTGFTKKESVETLVLDTLENIQKEGINTEIFEYKDTEGGYLAMIQFEIFDQKVPIKIDFSLREKDRKGEVVNVGNDFMYPYVITQLAVEQLSREKIQALLMRGKPRDFYDLYFLIRADLLTKESKNLLPSALEKIKSTDINFEKELKIFLPRSHWQVIRNLKVLLQREIDKFI